MAAQNDSYAAVIDAFSSDEFWDNRSSRSAVYAEMLLFFQFHTSRFGPFRCCDRWRVVNIGLWSDERECSGVQSQWWWMPLWIMVTSGEEKPPEAGSWRVASSASLRMPPSASMIIGESWGLIAREKASFLYCDYIYLVLLG